MTENLPPRAKNHESTAIWPGKQSGGILMKFIGFLLLMTLLLIVGGVIYLGSAELPAPTATVQIPVPDNAIQRQ